MNMKKFLVAFLSIVLLFTSIPFAASAEQSGNDDLVNKAAIVFPEFAEKLLTPGSHPSTHSNYASARVLVTSITRPASDKEYITYNEYSDGLIMLSAVERVAEKDGEPDFWAGSSMTGSSSGTNYRDITVNISATCVTEYYIGSFYLDGVSYRINNGVNNFDKITNPGTPREGTNFKSYTRTVFTENESYSGYARVCYYLSFIIGSPDWKVANSALSFNVGEDTAILSHINQS